MKLIICIKYTWAFTTMDIFLLTQSNTNTIYNTGSEENGNANKYLQLINTRKISVYQNSYK